MLEQFKEYLMQNVEMINRVEVLDITDDVRAKQASAGINGMTHIVIVHFDLGWHPLSIDSRKKTKRGWKAIVKFLNKSYEAMLKKTLEEQKYKLN